jgi:hypothetical protein
VHARRKGKDLKLNICAIPLAFCSNEYHGAFDGTFDASQKFSRVNVVRSFHNNIWGGEQHAQSKRKVRQVARMFFHFLYRPVIQLYVQVLIARTEQKMPLYQIGCVVKLIFDRFFEHLEVGEIPEAGVKRKKKNAVGQNDAPSFFFQHF